MDQFVHLHAVATPPPYRRLSGRAQFDAQGVRVSALRRRRVNSRLVRNTLSRATSLASPTTSGRRDGKSCQPRQSAADSTHRRRCCRRALRSVSPELRIALAWHSTHSTPAGDSDRLCRSSSTATRPLRQKSTASCSQGVSPRCIRATHCSSILLPHCARRMPPTAFRHQRPG